MTDRIPTRRVRFSWPDELEPVWTPRLPEMAVAANAVSLLMPHVEPYVVASVQAAADGRLLADASPDLVAEAHAYVNQEAQHHAQHRRFNRLLVGCYPALGRVDRGIAWALARLLRRSVRFGLAFAAGFETIAFVSAR